jgi:uncharacterized protein
VRTIVDTGPLVALLNQRDTHHRWVTEVLAGLDLPLWTCEAVLTEAAHLTGKPGVIMAMVADGALKLDLDIEDEAEALKRLLTRYEKRMALADACVVRMSELARDCRVFTLDRTDFSVYRRNGRDVIPLIAPAR